MPPIDLLIGTGNAHKVDEIRVALDGDLLRVRMVTEVIDDLEAPEETGLTFEDNARLKAGFYSRHTGMLCLADDSGLEVDALDGQPGVYSSRYAGIDGDDAANNTKLLRELDGVPDSDRGAQFRCTIAIATPDATHLVTNGICRGRILSAPRGDAGFGYDPLFLHVESGKTFAELSQNNKSEFSHRGAALAKVAEQLPALISILRNRIDN